MKELLAVMIGSGCLIAGAILVAELVEWRPNG